MALFRIRSIRPSFHAIIGWLILFAIGCILCDTSIASLQDYQQSRHDLSRYQSDCASITERSPGLRSGVCYETTGNVSFDVAGNAEGSKTMVADANIPGLVSSHVAVTGDFDLQRPPLPAIYHVQVWRGRVTQILFATGWRETVDNPGSHQGILALIGLWLATLIAWVMVVWMAACFRHGILDMRNDARPASSETAGSAR